MGGSIDVNVGVFWETSVGFLKSVVSRNIPNVMSIWMSKVGQNLAAFK